MNAVVEIADERSPIEDGGGYAWSVRLGTMRDITGVAQNRELACRAIGLALEREINAQGIHAYYDKCRVEHKNSGD